MKIFGIGTDIVKVSRLKKLIQKKSFLKRIFHKDEILKCSKVNLSASCFAKRYAAKEAFSKALGTGISKGISFNQIIIENEKSGKPFIKLIKKTKLIVKKKVGNKKYRISLSLSDESNYAVAFVSISI